MPVSGRASRRRCGVSRAVPPPNQQLFIMKADGSGPQTQLTFPPGFNLFASFGEIKK